MEIFKAGKWTHVYAGPVKTRAHDMYITRLVTSLLNFL